MIGDVAPARSPGGGGGAAGARRDVSDGGGGDGEDNGGNGGEEGGVGCGDGVRCRVGGGGGGGDDKVAGGSAGAIARGGRACDTGSRGQPLLAVLGSSMNGGGGDMSSRKRKVNSCFTNETT